MKLETSSARAGHLIEFTDIENKHKNRYIDIILMVFYCIICKIRKQNTLANIFSGT